MCTIAILVNVLDAPLVIAANRDELYARPTRAPEKLADGIAGGVDELSGGTWLAIGRTGRFAAVTNQRVMQPPPVGLRSRGLAVRELAMADDPDGYAHAIDPARFASMNLAWGDATGARVGYFRRETGEREIVKLGSGVHVLCNDKLGSPGFPRGERLARMIEAIVASSMKLAETIPAIEHALGDRARNELDDTPASDRLPRELARELTAICIHSDAYGTRSATVAAFDRGRVLAYDHADGPPDQAPFVDRRSLLA
ncbi:MAG TPA: NRDE family protein [Kofleriaceae bacterium]|jgi:uncharacterized protein with NRDE domain|nr:NRDE family protein [Kofleriaceae bacterium]